MKYLALLLIILMVGCCPTKKLKEQHTTVLKDSIFKKTELMIQPKIENEFVLREICDTITKKSVEFKKTIVRENDTIFIEVQDNELTVRVNSMERIISQKDQTIKEQEKLIQFLKEKVIVRKIIPFWVWILGAYVLIVALKKADNLLKFLPLPLRGLVDLIT